MGTTPGESSGFTKNSSPKTTKTTSFVKATEAYRYIGEMFWRHSVHHMQLANGNACLQVTRMKIKQSKSAA